MNRTIPGTRRLALTLGAAAGGLLLGALLPTAVAVAVADIDGYLPDPSTLFPITEVTGFPPYSPEEIVGNEQWSRVDFTTNQVLVPDQLIGPDTETIFGSFTNNDFATAGFAIDLANFGGGWGNEWLDLPSSTGISDLLITPFGDFPLFGTFF